jgi:hypothetical protein
MKIIKIYFLMQLLILLIPFETLGQNENKSFSDMTEEELFFQFTSANESKTVKESTIEIFKRGEKALPFLMRLKKNNKQYFGYCLGDPKGADSIFTISSVKGSQVNLEVASLYLVTAIYFNNLAFANLPYLSDRKQDKVFGIKGYNYNTPKRIKKAWESTENWYKKMQKAGLEKLRKDNEFPLKSSKIHFVGTNPDRKRDLSDCLK